MTKGENEQGHAVFGAPACQSFPSPLRRERARGSEELGQPIERCLCSLIPAFLPSGEEVEELVRQEENRELNSPGGNEQGHLVLGYGVAQQVETR